MPRLFKHLLFVSCILLLASCAISTPTPAPTSTPTPAPTSTPTPAPTSTPTPTPTSTPFPSPSHTAIPTSLPTPTPPNEHAQALRPEFLADLDFFPDATRYEIELIVDPDMTTVTGHERVAYTNTDDIPLDALYLRLFPNTPSYSGGMTATNILLDGQPVASVTELGGSALRFPLDPPLEPGVRLDLELGFTIAIPTDADRGNVPSLSKGYRQFGYYDGVLALTNGYPLIPVYDDEGWNVEIAPHYGDAIYSETSFYTVRITAPSDMTLIASGNCAPSTSGSEGSETWTCVTGPMRDFNVILGPDYQVESQIVEGITVNSFFYSSHRRAGEQVLDWAVETVRLFTRFGAYPFTELDVVETSNRAGGIEYPGLVVVNAAFYEPISESLEWIVVHEVGHQWWYSLVGNDQVDEPWLDEALTQYSTLLYFEDRYGAEMAVELLEGIFQQAYEKLVESGRDAPAGLPIAAYSKQDYGPVVYQKGPLYFHALRRKVGDTDFWEILQTYFTRNRYAIATPEDWLAVVEAVTGDEHRAIYEQWIER